MEKSAKTIQAEENLKKLFRENPDLKQAFKETIEEMRKPENVEKMAKEIATGVSVIKESFESGDFQASVKEFMQKHGIEKLTPEAKGQLAEELAIKIFKKIKGGVANV